MNQIVAVLVLPFRQPDADYVEGERDEPLLRLGYLGQRPPRVVCEDGVWHPFRAYSQGPVALAIAWDGELVPEGWDRLRRVLAPLQSWIATAPTDPTLQQLIGYAAAIPPSVGRVVLLAQDDEGQLMEFP